MLDADIEGCFDHIDHTALLGLRERIKDKKTVALVRAFLKAGVLSDLGLEAAAGEGTPQGGIISPLLANIALSVLDEAIMARGHKVVTSRPRLVAPSAATTGWATGGSCATRTTSSS